MLVLYRSFVIVIVTSATSAFKENMEFDEEVLSEIRNNLMSPTDIDPILISNLQGVRIRATGFPSLHGINDTGLICSKTIFANFNYLYFSFS